MWPFKRKVLDLTKRKLPNVSIDNDVKDLSQNSGSNLGFLGDMASSSEGNSETNGGMNNKMDDIEFKLDSLTRKINSMIDRLDLVEKRLDRAERKGI